MSNPDLTKYAYHYTHRLGWALAPAPLGQKRPLRKGWQLQENVITDPEKARRVFSRPQNLCLVHEFSNTCTLDIDHLEWARMALWSIGVDLDAVLEAATVRIRGKNAEKPLFRLPEGHGFKRKFISWPHPTELQPCGKPRLVTVFELRGGQGQDVLPPSIHPDTGRPYEWAGTPPRCLEDIPFLPPILFDLWTYFDDLQETMQDACEWRVAPPPRIHTPRTSNTPIGERPGDLFNTRVTPQEVLERNGYRRKGDRYLSPSSSTGTPGVSLLTREGRLGIYSHQSSCPLNDGRWHDAFSAFVILEHDGNLSTAVKAAAAELGLAPRRLPEAPSRPSYGLEEVRQMWADRAEDLLRQGGLVLDSMPGNHHMRNALIELWGVLVHIAPTSIQQHGNGWAINFGGLTRLKAYGVTGRNSDITARFRQLADLGYLLGVVKERPEDRTSPILLSVPADPEELGIMRVTREEARKKSLTLETKARRDTAKVLRTLPNKKKARPKGIGEGKAYFRFSGVGLNLLYLACGAASTVSELAYLRDKNPESIRRQVRTLQKAGIVTRKGHTLTVSMTWREFLEYMRLERENDEVIRGKVLRALERSEQNARRRAFGAGARIVPPRELAKRKRVWNLLRERVDRVRAGESLQAVLRLAA